jgi:hypothetical protein
MNDAELIDYARDTLLDSSPKGQNDHAQARTVVVIRNT